MGNAIAFVALYAWAAATVAATLLTMPLYRRRWQRVPLMALLWPLVAVLMTAIALAEWRIDRASPSDNLPP